MEGFEISKIKLKNSKEPSVEEKLTGSVITNLKDDNVEPNVELEGKEYLRFPDGHITRAEGEAHEKSGIKMNLPDGTTILSNSMTIPSSDLKKLNKEYDLNLKGKITYAEAQEKYRQKIGLKKLDKEQEEAITSLKKEMEKKDTDENTKKINEEFLQEEIGSIEKSKAALQPKYDGFFQEVFGLQESKKKPKNKTGEYKFGGSTRSNLHKVLEKYGLTEEELLGGQDIPEYDNGGGIDPADQNRRMLREMSDYISGITGEEYDVNSREGVDIAGEKMASFLRDNGIEFTTNEKGVGSIPSMYKAYSDHTGRIKNLQNKYKELGHYGGDNSGYMDQDLLKAHDAYLKSNKYSITGQGTFEDVFMMPSRIIDTNQTSESKEINGVRLTSVAPEEAGNLAQYTGNSWIKRDGGTINNYENGGEVDALRKKIKDGEITGASAQRELNTLKAKGLDVSELEGQVKYLLETSVRLEGGRGRTEEDVIDGTQHATDIGFGTVNKDNIDDVMLSIYREYPDYATEYLGVKFDEDGEITYNDRGYNDAVEEIGLLQKGVNVRSEANNKFVASKPEVFTDDEIAEAERFMKEEAFRGEGAMGVDNLLGKRTASIYNLKLSFLPQEELKKLEDNSIYTARQLMTKLEEEPDFVSEDSVGKLSEYMEGASDEVDFRLGAGKSVEPLVEDEPEVVEEGTFKTTEQEDDIVTETKRRFPKAFAHLDMTPLPPSPMEAHLKGQTNLQRIDPVRVGTQNVEQQMANQMGTVMTQIESLPPAQKAAAMATLQTSTNQALNQSIMQANQINAQNQSSAELFNIGQSAQEQQANLQNALSYERRQMLAKSNTQEDTRRYYDRLQSIALNEMQNNQKLNMLDQMASNYSLSPDGSQINFDPSSKYVSDSGMRTLQRQYSTQQNKVKNN